MRDLTPAIRTALRAGGQVEAIHSTEGGYVVVKARRLHPVYADAPYCVTVTGTDTGVTQSDLTAGEADAYYQECIAAKEEK